MQLALQLATQFCCYHPPRHHPDPTLLHSPYTRINAWAKQGHEPTMEYLRKVKSGEVKFSRSFEGMSCSLARPCPSFPPPHTPCVSAPRLPPLPPPAPRSPLSSLLSRTLADWDGLNAPWSCGMPVLYSLQSWCVKCSSSTSGRCVRVRVLSWCLRVGSVHVNARLCVLVCARMSSVSHAGDVRV